MNSINVLLALVALIQFSNAKAAIIPAIMLRKQRTGETLEQLPKLGAVECITDYMEALENLLEIYQRENKRCKDDESDKLAALLVEEQKSRDAINKSLNEINGAFDECKSEPENSNFFDCVANSGNKAINATNVVSKDSANIAASIKNQNHNIKFEAEECSKEAERAYLVGSGKIDDDYEACLANGDDLPTVPSTL